MPITENRWQSISLSVGRRAVHLTSAEHSGYCGFIPFSYHSQWGKVIGQQMLSVFLMIHSSAPRAPSQLHWTLGTENLIGSLLCENGDSLGDLPTENLPMWPWEKCSANLPHGLDECQPFWLMSALMGSQQQFVCATPQCSTAVGQFKISPGGRIYTRENSKHFRYYNMIRKDTCSSS
jgi:hypothetical protein